MDELGLTEEAVLGDVERDAARQAFGAVSVADASDDKKREALVTLKLPEQVRHLVGMLTAYDWEFVEQAKEIRGFVVARLLEEAEKGVRASDRLKALGLLGKVTEVGLFTDKVEVKQVASSDEELDARIKERINKLRGVQEALVGPEDVSDADAKPDA